MASLHCFKNVSRVLCGFLWLTTGGLLSYGFQTSARWRHPPPRLYPLRATKANEGATTPELSAKEDTTTISSFTIPRFYSGEVEEGSTYPSPLHTIYVKSVMTDQEVSHCRQLAYDHAETTGCWNQPDQGRHSTYSTCDFPVEDNEAMAAYLHSIDLDERIFGQLQDLYGVDAEYMSYLDFFCAHYQANINSKDDDTTNQSTTTMDRLEAHRDGSLLSFTILLNDPNEFKGGGTFFDGLRDVVVSADDNTDSILQAGGTIQPQRAGDATFHSGKLLHGASVITEGKRTVLVGFVDVADWIQRPGTLSQACRDWGRMDVAAFRYKRQLERTNNGARDGWRLNNARWMPTSSSCVRGAYVPAFASAAKRADAEYQRQKKLEAEDRLLRSILLPAGEVSYELDLLDGDVTVL